MLMQILLGIESSVPKNVYAHLLAFNEKGREVLSELKHKDDCGISIYPNISPDDCFDNPDLLTDVRADDIYSVIRGRQIYDHSDYVCKPFDSNI